MVNDSLACVYVTNEGFLPNTCFSIKALSQNSSIELFVYILLVGVRPKALAKCKSYLAENGVKAHYIDLPEGEFDRMPRPSNLPYAIYGRLLMHKFLPKNLSRVLYLDGDTLVDIDVAPLQSISLENSVIGAVVDVGRVLRERQDEARTRLQLGSNDLYFNSGMLLIDWHKWQALKIGERCLEALIAQPDRFTQPDQCALNYICRGNWKPLDLKWNYQPSCIIHDDRNAALVHFLGGRKPWRSDHARHPMKFVRRYEKLYRLSPWAAQFRPPRIPYFLMEVWRQAKCLITPRFYRNKLRYRKLARQYEVEQLDDGRPAVQTLPTKYA